LSSEQNSKELKVLLGKKELKARQIIAEFEQQVMRIDDFLHTEFKSPEYYFNEIKSIVNNKGSISSDDFKRDLRRAESLFSQVVQEFARCIAMLGRIKETLTKKLVKQIYKDINRLIVAQYKQEKRHSALRNKVDLLCYKIGFTVLEKQLREYPSGNIIDKYSQQLDLNAKERVEEDKLASMEAIESEIKEEEEKMEKEEPKEEQKIIVESNQKQVKKKKTKRKSKR